MPTGLAQAHVIECFHLALLQVLPGHLKREHYVVKGGANLRYFFKSVRYSEDIDFDTLLEEQWKLAEKADSAINSDALTLLLRQQDIVIANVNSSKQTNTTQRWKVLLQPRGRDGTISTRVEFSRRNGEKRWKLEPVPSDVVRRYGLRPPTLQHYLEGPATEQKIAALGLRSETQARDVFDLDLLFRSYPDAVVHGAVDSTTLEKAIERCLELPFDAFQAQVIPFLDPAIVELYDDREAWEQMQTSVAEKMESLDARD